MDAQEDDDEEEDDEEKGAAEPPDDEEEDDEEEDDAQDDSGGKLSLSARKSPSEQGHTVPGVSSRMSQAPVGAVRLHSVADDALAIFNRPALAPSSRAAHTRVEPGVPGGPVHAC